MALSGVGFLKQTSDKVREYMDDSTAAVRFTDAQVTDTMHLKFQEVMEEINRVSLGKIRARLEITIAIDQREYVLPPGIGTFLEFKKLDTNGNPEWEMIADHPLSPQGPGFTIEGGILLRLDPQWSTGHTMTIVYTPNAECTMFEVSSTAFTASTVTVPASVTVGAVDFRPNGYLGYVIQIIDSVTGLSQQDRIISDQDNTTPGQPVLTVKPDFAPALSGTEVFQVLPQYAARYQDMLALKVAGFYSSIRKNRESVEFLGFEYQKAQRALRLQQANIEGRRGHRFHRSIRGRRMLGKTR